MIMTATVGRTFISPMRKVWRWHSPEQKARSALYHNNHDGTFTDVTDKAGVGYPCWAMGAVVGDYNNDGWPDLLVTCFGGVVLYRNNGDGTFTDVTKAGRTERRFRMGNWRGFWRL